MMWMNRSLPMITNMAPTGGWFGSEQRPDDNVGVSEDKNGNTRSKDTQFGQSANQFYPPLWYSNPPSQAPFLSAPHFYEPAPFNITASSERCSGATQGYLSYGPLWQAYDFHKEGYGGPQMFPSQQITGHGPSSPGTP